MKNRKQVGTGTWVLTMFFFVTAFCLIGAEGCNQEPPLPPPEIQVERTDSLENTGVTVYFNNHMMQNNRIFVVLPTTEDIAQYRRQVEFLLLRLEEAENRMNVHEDQSPKPEQAPK